MGLAEEQGYTETDSLSVEADFILNLYAGVHCLFHYIHRLSDYGGETLERYFKRYPFLEHYFTQLSHYMPSKMDWQAGKAWWQQNIIELEQEQNTVLPLFALHQEMGLSFESRMALMLAGLVEEDSRFGTLFSQLQQPLGYRRPMLETLGQIVLQQIPALDKSPWDVCAPLLQNGLLIAENPQAPRSEWVVKLPQLIWEMIRGGRQLQQSLPGKYLTVETLTKIDDYLMESEFTDSLKAVPQLIRSGQVKILILRATPGSNSVDALGAVARQLDKGILLCQDAAADNFRLEPSFVAVCIMLNVLPVFNYELTPGETVKLPDLKQFNGPIGVIMSKEGGLSDLPSEQVLTLNMPNPGPVLREKLWQQHIPKGWQLENPEAIARRFRLPGEYIRQIANMSQKHAALASNSVISQQDVQLASRSLNRQMLDELADPLEAKGHWHQLITVDTTAEKLQELQQRCRYREQLLEQLGQAFANSSNCGVRALFTGRSGTGKTLAAKILASELGMDIYRVDLASIVNKYIGETEKNLHKVLTRAEALDVILLLDEGDALLGSRTDVKNANDRYANLETNYLLQRLEHYQGIVLITTNLADNIDKAFQRRMDIVIPFFQPQMEQRLAIFYLHLPQNHEVDPEYLEKVCRHCNLMGGQIRNVCMHASLIALEEQDQVREHHLEAALRSEFRKNGATYPLDKRATLPVSDGGMGTFISALNQNR